MSKLRTITHAFQFTAPDATSKRLERSVRAIREAMRRHYERLTADPTSARIAGAWEAARTMNLNKEQMAALRRAVLKIAGRKP